jgi:hypothetical protein
MGSDDIKYFSSKRVKRKGREDGRDWYYDPCFPFRKPKESDPPLDQDAPSLFEENLSGSANTNIAAILTEWSKEATRPPSAWGPMAYR